jgi:hypothetical protein
MMTSRATASAFPQAHLSLITPSSCGVILWGQIFISRVESGRLLPWHDPCV